MSFKKELAAMSKAYNAAKKANVNATVDEGKYKCSLMSATMSKSSKDGTMLVIVNHLVLEGEFENAKITQFFRINDTGLPFLCEWIRKMGYEVPDDVEDLEEVIKQIAEAEPTYMLTAKKSKKDERYFNYYIDRLLTEGDDEAGESEDKEDKDAEDEKPSDGESDTEEEGSDGDEVEIEVGSIVTFKDDKKRTKKGEVTEINEKKEMVTVEVEGDEDSWELEFSEILTVEGGEEAEEEDEEEEEAEEESPSTEDLIELASAHDLEVNDDSDRKDVLKKIKKAKWSADDLTSAEVALLEEIEVEVAPTKKKAPKTVAKVGKKSFKAKKSKK